LLDSEDAVLRKIFSLDLISFASSFAAEVGSKFFSSSSTIGSVLIGLQWRVPKS
jgi:hypothetical protein